MVQTRVRRVVTGHSPDGKSIIASDMNVDAITTKLLPGWDQFRLWGADETPRFPDDGSPYPAPSFFPPVGGFRFGLFTVPPESTNPPETIDPEEALREFEQKLPGIFAFLEPNTPGIHTTNTIDFEYVISGEVYLMLDDGVEVHLHPGDTVVQNGTRHMWQNRGSEPCYMVLCMIGAHRRGGR